MQCHAFGCSAIWNLYVGLKTGSEGQSSAETARQAQRFQMVLHPSVKQFVDVSQAF